VWPARIPRPTAVSIQREQSCGPTEPSFRGSAGNRSGVVSAERTEALTQPCQEQTPWYSIGTMAATGI
jgi:hypothetical protein